MLRLRPAATKYILKIKNGRQELPTFPSPFPPKLSYMDIFVSLKVWIQKWVNEVTELLTETQFSSVTRSCPALCNPVDCSTLGFPVLHQLPELTQTHVHGVGDAIQPSHPLSSPSPPSFNLSQHQGLFKWVSSSHQVAKGLEFQLQH